MTGLFVKYSCFSTLAKCLPAHCNGVPTACLLRRPTCLVTHIVYKQVISQLVKYKRVVGTQQVSDLRSNQILANLFYLGYIYGRCVRNGQVAKTSTSALFPRLAKYQQLLYSVFGKSLCT